MNDTALTTRRSFLASAGRCSAAAALVSGMGLLVLHNRRDENCAQVSPCRSCSLFTGCTLDRAEEARRIAQQQQSTATGAPHA